MVAANAKLKEEEAKAAEIQKEIDELAGKKGAASKQTLAELEKEKADAAAKVDEARASANEAVAKAQASQDSASSSSTTSTPAPDVPAKAVAVKAVAADAAQKKEDDGTSSGLVVGIVFGVLLLALAIGGLVAFKVMHGTGDISSGQVAPAPGSTDSDGVDLEQARPITPPSTPSTAPRSALTVAPAPSTPPTAPRSALMVTPAPSTPPTAPESRGECSRCGGPVFVAQERDRDAATGPHHHTNPRDCSKFSAALQASTSV